MHLAKNSTIHSRSKHIDLRYNWIREALNEKLLEPEKIQTNNNCYDMLMEVLERKKCDTCCSITRMENPST